MNGPNAAEGIESRSTMSALVWWTESMNTRAEKKWLSVEPLVITIETKLVISVYSEGLLS